MVFAGEPDVSNLAGEYCQRILHDRVRDGSLTRGIERGGARKRRHRSSRFSISRVIANEDFGTETELLAYGTRERVGDGRVRNLRSEKRPFLIGHLKQAGTALNDDAVLEQ